MIGIFINLWNRLVGGGGAPTPALLDEYGGAAAAYSLRKLSSTYGGSAVRVRRSSDNTEQDIGFDGQNLDETALMNFVGYQNLLQRSEEFENAYWTKTNLIASANTTTSPNGTLTADTITETAVSGRHQVLNSITTISGQTYTFSIYAKQAVGTRLFGIEPVGSGGAGNNQVAVFDLVNGIFLGSPAGAYVGAPFDSSNTSIQSVGNGWYRVSTTTTVTGTTYAVATGLLNAFSTAGMSYLGDGTSGVYLWGAQLNVGTTAQPYQVTTSAARSGDGFVTKWYTQDSNGENLLLQSQTFENASWVKTILTSSANTTTAPDGTLTADSIIPTTVFNNHYTIQPISKPTANNTYNLSCYIKANGYSYGVLAVTGAVLGNQAQCLFDLVNGTTSLLTFGTGFTPVSSSISSAGNGWYRVSLVFISDNSNQIQPYIRVDQSAGVSMYAGDGTSGLFVWGAQLSQSSWLQGYQATTTAQVFRRDVFQTTAANQPRIVGGGVIERENGKAGVRFLGTSGMELKTSYNTPVGAAAFFSAARQYVAGGGVGGIITADGGGGGLVYFSLSVPNGFVLDGSGAGVGNTASFTYNALSHMVLSGLYTSTTTSGTYLYSDGLLIQNFTGVGVNRVSSLLSIGGRTGGSNPTRVFNGIIQEGLYYESNQLSNVLSIDRNLGGYYQTHWTGASSGLLDQFGGAAAAYSLRNLSSSYRGPLIRVRRSSDNAETDIGGTYSGDLDVASLLSFTGGQNLVTNSEDFSLWSPTRASATVNTTIAPNGTLTADTITANTTSVSGAVLFSAVSTSPSIRTEFTASVYIKSGNKSFFALVIYDGTNGVRQYFNLSTGEVGSAPSFGAGIYKTSASIQSVGNGWFRCSLSVSVLPSVNVSMVINPISPSDNNLTCTVGDFAYVWGAQLNTGILQPYIPTTTTAVNGANAFVTKWYDQSGQTRDAIQATAASQPRIVNSGGVESEGNRPAVFWTDGSGMRLTASFPAIPSPQSFFVVNRIGATSGISGPAALFDSYNDVQNVYYFKGLATPNNIFAYADVTVLNGPADPIPVHNLTNVIHDTVTNVYDNNLLTITGSVSTNSLSGLSIGGLRGNPSPIIAGYDWFGDIQELLVYPSNLATRLAVNSNINSYYRIYWQGNGTALLDNYSGASAAYSLRNLSSAYTGPLIRVRRSIDNVERDIYGTFGGDLDIASLVAFVGANSGFVTTWYDQSGNARNATQATAGSQPRIVNAGVVDTENGKPSIFFDGTNDSLGTTGTPFSSTDTTLIGVSKQTAVVGTCRRMMAIGEYNDGRYLGSNLGANQMMATFNNETLTCVGGVSTTRNLSVAYNQGVNGFLRQNGTQINTVVANNASYGNENLFIGTSKLLNLTEFWNGISQENIAYPNSQSSNIVGIESNINNYYKIY